MATYATGKDLLLLPDGSTYHLGTKKGEVFARIITVGSTSRAETIAKHFDASPAPKVIHSNRHMSTYSGYYKGVGISVIAIGMGAPMMDFMLREATYCEEGPLAVIRLGTCGVFNKDQRPGDIMCASKGSMYSYVNYAHYTGCPTDKSIDYKKQTPPYLMCNPVPCDAELDAEMVKQLKAAGCSIHQGLNACAETFYACQGRLGSHFKDENEKIVSQFLACGVDAVEMEMHQLFHLASLRKVPMKAAGCAIGVVHRTNDSVTDAVSADKLHEMESVAGKACLEALANIKL